MWYSYIVSRFPVVCAQHLQNWPAPDEKCEAVYKLKNAVMEHTTGINFFCFVLFFCSTDLHYSGTPNFIGHSMCNAIVKIYNMQ